MNLPLIRFVYISEVGFNVFDIELCQQHANH